MIALYSVILSYFGSLSNKEMKKISDFVGCFAIFPQMVQLSGEITGIQFPEDVLFHAVELFDVLLRCHIMLFHKGETAVCRESRVIQTVNGADTHIVDRILVFRQLRRKIGVAVHEERNFPEMFAQLQKKLFTVSSISEQQVFAELSVPAQTE